MTSRAAKSLICLLAATVLILILVNRIGRSPIADGDAGGLNSNDQLQVSALEEMSTRAEKARITPMGTLMPQPTISSPSNQVPRTISEPYQYPVLPGTEAWKERVGTQPPWSLCQIPEHLLTKLTDSALLNTCLRYPMRGDIHAFNSLEAGLAVTIKRFNGLEELLSRPGIPSLLKEHFLSMTVDQFGVKQISNENQGFLDLGFVSTLLLHPDILSRLTAMERPELCEKALRLQAEIRERYGRSGSEEPAAQLAASLLASGTQISTRFGSVDGKNVFSTDAPWTEQPLSDRMLDSLNAIGEQMLRSAPRP